MDVCAGEQMGCPGDVSYVRLSRLSRRRLGYDGYGYELRYDDGYEEFYDEREPDFPMRRAAGE